MGRQKDGPVGHRGVPGQSGRRTSCLRGSPNAGGPVCQERRVGRRSDAAICIHAAGCRRGRPQERYDPICPYTKVQVGEAAVLLRTRCHWAGPSSRQHAYTRRRRCHSRADDHTQSVSRSRHEHCRKLHADGGSGWPVAAALGGPKAGMHRWAYRSIGRRGSCPNKSDPEGTARPFTPPA